MAIAFSKFYSVLGTSLSHVGVFAYPCPKKSVICVSGVGNASFVPPPISLITQKPTQLPDQVGRAQGPPQGTGRLHSARSPGREDTLSPHLTGGWLVYNFMLGCIFKC